MNDRETILKAPCQCGSGKPLGECHGDSLAAAPLAAGPVTRRLDLACGQNPREGFEGVDIWPGAQHVVDLQRYPWPFADGSVHELHCSHYIEHIPMKLLDDTDRPRIIAPVGGEIEYTAELPRGYFGKDALLAFFDECYRILADDGAMTVIWPSNKSDRAFQDPTHRRFIPCEMLHYLSADWRRANKLDHYLVECNFYAEAVPTIGIEVSLRHEMVQANHLRHMWNMTLDWIAKMTKMPRAA